MNARSSWIARALRAGKWVALVGVLVACAAGPTPVVVPIAEAFDVPPPPGMRTLELGPVHGVEVEPGVTVRASGGGQLLLSAGDVVDVRTTGAGVTLTVYVPEAEGDALLAYEGPLVLNVE